MKTYFFLIIGMPLIMLGVFSIGLLLEDKKKYKMVMELLIGLIGIGCGLFFLYVNIVSRLNYDVFIDNDDESYEGELL